MASSMKRILKLKENKGLRDVVVEVFWPEQRERTWFSDWRIVWPDRERKGSAGGLDAIQSLVCALKIVGAEIYCGAEHQAGLLSWSDDWSGYGFPVPNGIRDLLTGDDAEYL